MNIIDSKIKSSYSEDSYLQVRVKTNNKCKNAILLLHGLSLPFYLNYDFPLDGKSAADLMVENETTCIMISALGYGKSSMYKEMFEEPKESSVLLNSYDDWIRDINDTLNWCEDILGITKLTIVGWSASAVPALTVGINDSRIDKIVIYGMPIHSNMPLPDKTPNYRLNNPHQVVDGLMKRRIQDIPKEHLDRILPFYWFKEWADAILAENITKVPNGTYIQRLKISSGEESLDKYFTWDKVTKPILFTSGEWDSDFSYQDHKKYYDQCVSEYKEIDYLSEGSHWMLLETTRKTMADRITNFAKK